MGMELVVSTRSGAVRGAFSGDVAVFRGIPYAAPLDGARRFQAPAAPEAWDGVREATAFSASVPQATVMPAASPWWTPGDDTDCLSVNVWSPDIGAGLPVMVWIHGGAYMGGTSDSPAFDGTRLAQAGVVVVTLNYRVGYEGFGWVADAPANRGILDQLAALRWVQDNIASFGGDPGNVTIFGESSGASSVVTLAAGSAKTGLFRRGIAQSVGAVFCGAEETRRISDLIVAPLGVAATSEALGEVPSEAIHAAQLAVMAEQNRNRADWTNSTPFAVVPDGELLDDLPWVALRDGAGRDIELISGYNTDEARLFTVDFPVEMADPALLAHGLRLAPSVLEEYRAGYPGIADADLHSLLLSDQLFRMPSLWCAEGHAQAGERSYAYEFAWPSPARDGALGACHGLDVPFTFGVDRSDVTEHVFSGEAPADFEALSAAMRESWVSFATNGDPGWPAYALADRQVRIWNTPPTVATDPVGISREIWQHRF
ncbi:para-nitrobenzyl esterase [Saccharopolyspora antimicrobica]|uniref:Carboxylic ester hydrolase n=2 Tax=Saccharopolyspora antimicrobica TaxID=455193 RepID=A0A1I4SG88_9PSEU|nr:carboxylesterase family protein [Saccharopolyspora antimicrobica]RKT87732.1 para-nitrobenzyl esterase [Saccharopolyspora antimicrobica]SFM63479.1 para-nitrobenzyl esterase [Saccharopolyspora antimicrobica]